MTARKKDEVEITIDPNSGGVGSIPKSVHNRLGNVENVTQAVLWVGIISLVALIITVSVMVIDQFHFNSQTYRNESDKTNLQIEKLQLEIQALKVLINSSNSSEVSGAQAAN